jgi:hypothetical protein
MIPAPAPGPSSEAAPLALRSRERSSAVWHPLPRRCRVSFAKVSSWSSELTPPASTRPTGMVCAAYCGVTPPFLRRSAVRSAKRASTNPCSFENASALASAGA